LCKHLIVSFSRESTDSQKKNMEDESQTKHVANWIIFALHILDIDNFRSYIPRSSASDEQVLDSI